MDRREEKEDAENVDSEYDNVRQKMGTVKAAGLRQVNTARMVKLKSVFKKKTITTNFIYVS
jgi:hypothetical protein